MRKDGRLTQRELGIALDKLGKASSQAYVQRCLIADHCEAVYGCDPADIDNDLFIDAVDGGAGLGCRMTPEEFHSSMVECLSLAGLNNPLTTDKE